MSEKETEIQEVTAYYQTAVYPKGGFLIGEFEPIKLEGSPEHILKSVFMVTANVLAAQQLHELEESDEKHDKIFKLSKSFRDAVIDSLSAKKQINNES